MLGILREPLAGYDIKNQFSGSLRHFWSAELSQIYPLLKKMEAEGLLTSQVGPSDKGPKRKIYRRTDKGKNALVSWLAEGPHDSELRVGHLAQVYFLANLNDKDSAIEFFEDLKHVITNRLENLKAIEKRWSEEDPRYPDDLPDEDFYPQLTLHAGLMRLGATVSW